jgi:DNA-directed RNA polymerase sigma subunit (sigma70/sigma32)
VDERLLTELGRNPTTAEIAEGLHMTLSETEAVAEMLDNLKMLNRVKAPQQQELPQEEDQAVEDTAYFQMRQRINELLSVLPEGDAKLLTLRFGLEGGLPMTPEDAGVPAGSEIC